MNSSANLIHWPVKTALRATVLALLMPLFASAADKQPTTEFELGQQSITGGDSIEITSVERHENELIVSGIYELMSREESTLALYFTLVGSGSTPKLHPRQRIKIMSKGQGSFELVHPLPADGLPHITFYGRDGKPFGGVYFGTHEQAERSRALNLSYCHGPETSTSSSATLKPRNVVPREAKPLIDPPSDNDTDGDGLSDFAETHKYFTDPAKKDSDGDGTPDGEAGERREYAYSIRTVVRIMKPYDLVAMNDDYQDARLLRETDEFGEIEVIHYPLNTVADAIKSSTDWRTKSESMQKWLKPGITTNWDVKMRERLVTELREAGIDADTLSDQALAEQTANWMLRTTKSPGYMFTTYFMDFSNGAPTLLPGCERAYDREKGKAGWSFDEQLQREVFGAGMFDTKTRGTCTSSAIYWTTVLRALGLPTRMVLCIPGLDGNDKEQVRMIERDLSHHRVRAKILSGIENARGFSAHTFNEVSIGGRWVRLNYRTLGQNILDERFFGLLTHTLTFGDLSEANLAPTWGKRYALGQTSDELPTSNPFKTLELSDQFGSHAKIDNPPAPKRADHAQLTIKRMIWADSPQRPAWLKLNDVMGGLSGYAVLLIEPVEHFTDQDYRQYRRFLDAADPAFVLESADGTKIKATYRKSFYTLTTDCEISLLVGDKDVERMKPGEAYRLVPANGQSDAPRWVVKEGVTISKPKPDKTNAK